MERKRVIPGANGLGKITLIMKPRRKRSILRPLIALVVYPIFFFLIFISYAWLKPNLKYSYALPALRGLVGMFGFARTFRLPQPAPVELNDQNFTVIASGSLLDTLREQGRVHAMERLFQMDVDRRTALGTLSAVFGQKTLYLDKWARTMNFGGLAASDYEALSASTKAQLQSYADGVNDYLSEFAAESLPLDFDLAYGPWAAAGYPPAPEHDITSIASWTPIHSLAILRMTLYASSRGWEDDIIAHVTRKIDRLVKLPISRILVDSSSSSPWRPGAIPSLGGTALAISASASASGSAILAHNHYSSPQSQRFWYRNCLIFNAREACGLSLPGLPWLLHGRTASHAWALLADPRPEAEQLFSTTMPTKPATQRTETIVVYGEDNVTLTIRSMAAENDVFVEDLLAGNTRRVINVGRVALRSNFFEQRVSPDFLMDLLVEDQPASHFSLGGLPFQLVYALHEGDIGRVLSDCPAVSMQPPVTMQALPRVAGSSEASLSSSSVGQEKAKVWIAASTDLLSAVDDLRARPDDCSLFALCHLIRKWEETGQIAVEDVQAVMHDDFSPSGFHLHRFLQESALAPPALLSDSPFLGQYSTDSLDAARVELLRTYLLNNLYTVTSFLREGSLSEDPHDIFPALSHRTLSDHYATILCGQNITAIRRPSVLHHRTQGVLSLLRDDSRPDGLAIVLQNATQAITEFLVKHFTLNATWGDVHRIVYPHVLEPITPVIDTVLSRGPLPARGGLDSVNLAEYSGHVGGHGLTYRELVHSHRHDFLTAFSSLAVMQEPVQRFAADGYGLESTHASRWTATGARLHRGVWTSVQQAIDTVAGGYRPSRASSPVEL